MQDEPLNFLPSEPEGQEPPRSRIVFLILSALILFGGLFFITRTFFATDAPEDPTAYDPITLEPLKPSGFLQKIRSLVFKKEVALAGAKDDRINILLLGQGGPGHDGPYLTDTILIASVKPSSKELALISIPRDLAVNIPGHGVRKINNANAFGEAKDPGFGPAFTARVLKETFDIDLNYYIRVDFKAFAEVVDDVGGVKIDVDRAFTDYEYPAANDLYQTVSFQVGEQTMDGDTALKFARSRHGGNGEGSDFARAKRQQKILLALKEKVLSFQTLANPIKINNILTSLHAHIVTNMEFSDIISLIKFGKELDSQHILTLTLDNSETGYLRDGVSPEGAYILEPRSGNFDEVSAAIKDIFSTPTSLKTVATPTQEAPTEHFETANIEIQNGTWQAGLAARLKKELTDKNFAIMTIGNTEERPQPESGIYAVNQSSTLADTLQSLSDTLGVPIKEKNDLLPLPASTTDILVIIGEDYQETI